jgi:Flp pilus assembly protein TadG
MQGSEESMMPTKRWGVHATASKGQALVEMALVLPVMALLLGVAYTASDAMHSTIGLTSAARAGAIVAANDLRNSMSSTQALTDATSTVNAEENVNIYQSGGGCTDNCVTLAQPTGGSSSINLVQITITHSVTSALPLLSGIKVSTQAAARTP